MRSMFVLAAATAMCWGPTGASTALAQDANKLYEQFKEATGKVKAVSYTGHVSSKETSGQAAMPTIKGKVIMTLDMPERADLRGKFFLSGEMSSPAQTTPSKFEIGFDGKVIRNIVHDDNRVDEIKIEGDDPIPFFEEPMMLLGFHYWHDEDEMREPSAIKHMGQADLDGVKCDILIVEREMEMPGMAPGGDEGAPASDEPTMQKITIKTRLHVGEADHLLRRVEYTSDPKKEEFTIAMSMTDLKVDPTLEPASFEVKTPEGYTVTQKTYEDLMAGPRAKFKVGDVAGDWTLKDADGKEHKLSEFKGKVVVMDFWATWCQPCKLAMPGLQKLHEEWKDKGVVVVGVNMADDPDKATKYMAKQKFTYLSLLNGDEVAQTYGIGPIPQFYVIGVDGKVIHHVIGYVPEAEAELSRIIKQHLDEQKK